MNAITRATSVASLPVPQPRVAITTRVATMADIPFLDQLQKQYHKQLGFFPRAQLEGYVANGWILIAEDAATKQPLGYCASRDRYLKRDELGVIYQLCVAPGHQRGLIGASLIKAVFERSAYGCRLYCCWCAQDLDANYFWESLGFVPIAFRGGSGKKKRVHIFWQKRIDADRVSGVGCRVSGGNEEAAGASARNPTPEPRNPIRTPYWYPAKTDQGAMREDRLVLPIPPGLHWRDAMPVLSAVEGPVIAPPAMDADRGLAVVAERKKNSGVGSRGAGGDPKPRVLPIDGPVKHGPRQYGGPPPVQVVSQQVAEKVEKIKPPKKEKAKVDPKLIAKARELRDRYLEHVNGSPDALPAPGARYDVSRTLSDAEGTGSVGTAPMHIEAQPLRQLPSAA